MIQKGRVDWRVVVVLEKMEVNRDSVGSFKS
jgi:hypothetical protein